MAELMADVALTVGGAFLSGFLQVLFDRLASREVLNLFSNRKTNVDGLLKELKRKLLLLNKVLDDADVKQFTDRNVRAWSDEARDAVYQADDLLSEITYEARRRQVESDPEFQSRQAPKSLGLILESSLGQVKNWFSNRSNSFDDNIESKLTAILQLLDNLLQEVAVLGLKEGVRRGANMPTNRSSSSLVVDVYGRESEKKQLIDRLLQLDETSVDVIPVVGMGGMGKTTLVQFAYNDHRVNEKFKTMKAWVCVSKQFDVLQATKTILESITRRSCTFTDLNQVQESLKKELNGIKFLIVLDDVWNKNYGDWDTLRTPFRTGAPGSKIIVTTRIQGAADIMRSGPVIKLAELSDDYCWQLFADIAFGESSPSSYPPQLEEIGRKIVKRCRGLPLAVKSIAGLLRSKQLDVGEWEDVLNSDFWDLPEDECDILPALRLSYHYLPSCLKQCFAFCSLFPKNHNFEEKETVSLWIAQKFVLPFKGSSYELEGKKYFRELLSMSFFQKSAYNESQFVMHDLIHDLAKVVSGQFFFRLDGGQPHAIPGKVRHCSYEAGGFRQLHAATEVNTLRTFLLITFYMGLKSYTGLDIAVLSRQKHMRVLSLPSYDKLNELADLVGGLLHLQYLDLSHTNIQQLPESICRLYNLETLLLKGCYRLSSLPVEMGKLISLRRLDITGTSLKEMPIQMSQLKRLEYLSTFFVGKESGLAIGGLKALNSLRGDLEISGLENVKYKKDALEAKLVEKEALETLALGWGGVTNDSQHEREVLDCLRPHRHLKVLRIRNYGGTRCPDWLGDRLFAQMVSLRLQGCRYCSCLPPLCQLASLKELSVIGMSRVTDVGEEFFGGANQLPFLSLEALCFKDMVEWVIWSLPGTGEFPKLRKLEIISCPKLVGTLPQANIATFVIKIMNCPMLEALVPSSSSPPPSIAAPAADAGLLELRWCERVELNWLAMSDLVDVDISDLPSLQVLTSELSALTKLETLTVARCRNLLSLSNSGLPRMLTTLVIRECELLQSVVDGTVYHNTCSLRRLDVSSCPLLASFADNGLPTTLKHIHFSMCPKLELTLLEGIEMCPSVESLTGKLELRLSEREELNWLAMSDLVEVDISDLPSLQVLTSELSALTKLKTLRIGRCPNLLSLSNSGLPPMLTTLKIASCPNLLSLSNSGLPPMLKTLEIKSCELLQSVVDGMVSHNTCSLEWLEIRDCPLLASFADNGPPTTLEVIKFSMCPKLELSLSEGIEMCPSVWWLNLDGCPSLQFLILVKLFPNVRTLDTEDDDNLSILNIRGCPQGGGRLANLAHLTIRRCKNLKALPEGMCDDLFPSLETLCLRECPEIESLFEVSHLSKLRRLEIEECEKLTSFDSDWGLHRLPSLTDLKIRGAENEHVESFPNEGLLPSTLTELEIGGFENLKKLNWRGIRQLTSLEFLLINDCCQLESLPDKGLPPSLLTLRIYDCPLLKPRCKKDSGDYWPKIAHIPEIIVY